MAVMSAIALGAALGGTALSVVGQVKAGNAAKRAGEAQQRAANSQADLADYNAAVAEVQAQDAIARGAEDESRFRQGVRTLIGSQRAGFAAGNVDVGFGSAVDVQADAAMLGELDALTIRTNAAREAWGYKVQAEDLRRRGQIARKEGVMFNEAGRTNQSAARWGAGGTLLNTGASLLEARYGFGVTRRSV
jgi:hypothetical protein